MPGPYGVTPTGWVSKPASEILAEITAAQVAAIDPGLDTSPESVVGCLDGIMTLQFSQLWEIGQMCSAAMDPNNASYAQLAAVAQLTGTVPRAAQPGTVSLHVQLAGFATLNAGSIAYVPGQPQNTWATNVSVTNTNSTPQYFDVPATAPDPGYQVAAANSITAMFPVTGWLSVTNPLDAIPGQDAETDAQVRVRRQTELAQGGSSAVPAIQRALLEVANVVQAVVYENPTDTTNAMGLPPHGVMCLVDGGADTDVATAIFNAKGAGIQTVGLGTNLTYNRSQNVIDANGQSWVINWQRPQPLNIYIQWSVDVDPATYAQDPAVLAAIVGYMTGLLAGQPVRVALLERAVLAVPGVLDVAIQVGTTSAVAPVNAVIPQLMIANLINATPYINQTNNPWSEGP